MSSTLVTIGVQFEKFENSLAELVLQYPSTVIFSCCKLLSGTFNTFIYTRMVKNNVLKLAMTSE